MTELNEHRRDLIKADTISGTTTTVETDSDEIYLPDAMHTKLQTLSFEGNTFQQTYEGYNLFNIDLYKEGESLGYTISDKGIVTFAENSADIRYSVPITFEAGTYTISAEGTTGCVVGGPIIYGTTYAWVGTGTPSKKFTLSTQTTIPIFIVKTTSATTGTISNIQITKSETVLPYEPYVGGIPSPNAGQVIVTGYEEPVEENIDLQGYTNYKTCDVGGTTYMLCTTEKIKLRGNGYNEIRASNGVGISIPDFTIAVATSQEAFNTGQGVIALQYGTTTYSATLNEDYYIAVGNTNSGISADEENTYWEYLQTATLSVVPEKGKAIKTEIPAFPQPIQNSSNVSVELVGANIFDIDTVLGNMSDVTQNSNGIWVIGNIGMVYRKVLFTNELKKQGKLTLRVRQKTRANDPTRDYLAYLITYTDGTNVSLIGKGINEFTDYIYTTNENKTVDTIRFSYYGNATTDIESIMINWGEPLPYQPYFKSTVNLPSEVTLASGKVVPLRFARLGTVNNVAINKADTLTIDKVANKVTYTQYLGLFKPKAPYVANYYYYNGTKIGIRFNEIILQIGARQKGICTHGGRVGNYWSPLDIWIGVGSRAVYWLGILNKLGFNSEWVDKTKPTTEEWAIAKEKIETYFAEQEANGTPFEVLYELPTPTEYDLTETELGQELLRWARTKKGTNKISLTSDGAEVSHIKATYYSDKHEDKLELVVSFKNESGVEIKDAQLHQVRANSKYTYLAPLIDGYVSSCDRVEGYMTQATEITIVYKEK